MGTYNRCVKNRLEILNRLWKNEISQDPSGGGIFFDSHCTSKWFVEYNDIRLDKVVSKIFIWSLVKISNILLKNDADKSFIKVC